MYRARRVILNSAKNLGGQKYKLGITDSVGLAKIEIKHILKQALTDKINDRELYMKGIDHSYYYEGYSIFKTNDL